MSPVKKPVAVFNLDDDNSYAGGGGLPEGNYIWTDLTVMMHSGFSDTAKNAARLGVMITMVPLEEPDIAKPHREFYSMGSKANLSFAPDPDGGKNVMPIPGAPSTTLNASTNWAILRKSLRDCGLPVGILTEGVGAIEGIHVHMQNVPAPEERKGFSTGAATGEASAEQGNRKDTIAVVTEIMDDGKPWEGSGGIPEKKAAGPKGVVKPPAAKPAVKGKAKPEPEPEEAATDVDEDVMSAAVSGISAVLEKNADGCPRLLLRTGTFKAVKSAEGDDVAQAVIETFFGDDTDKLNGILGELGYVLDGQKVVVK